MTDKDKRKPNDDPDHVEKMPPAGPHARPDLIDEDKTPGSGILPKPDEDIVQPTG